jgi:hypothetical protein
MAVKKVILLKLKKFIDDFKSRLKLRRVDDLMGHISFDFVLPV